MKIFTVILLVLLINPTIANDSISLYQKSGGYEKSGGYNRSGGYEKSREGYITSEGYNKSGLGYEKSEEGYTPINSDGSPQISKRLVEKRYDQQINKTKLNKGKWVAERHKNEGTSHSMRSKFRESGGNDDLIDQ